LKDFNFDALDDFDKHISMSIPHYESLFDQVKTLVETFSEDGYPVIDVGCSTGRLIRALDIPNVEKVGVDLSELINEAVSLPLEHNRKFRKGDFFDFDTDNNAYYKGCSVVVSMFFLQFLGIRAREKALIKMKDMLMGGGTLIVCEKTSCDDSQIENVFRSKHLEWKRSHFSDEEILDKSQSLMNSMRTLSDGNLQEELSRIGEPHLFFKSMGFSGYILRKEDI